ncbi:Ser/Thr protein kinase RdoA (MazF antagonist) [Arthrobacter ulcerisalmonis]|nr:phosphotransferase [Arthrobacter ulcerisalmonis]MDQ0662808.1 Ser/Thr protein kinase RdoA (MazF antagonist) [Arthrobacter ulcerisalmonis]
MNELNFQPGPTDLAAGVTRSRTHVLSGVTDPSTESAEHGLLHSPVARQGGRLPATAVDEAALFPLLQNAYGFGRWRSWRRTDKGSSNISWFVQTDAGEMVLRRSHNLKAVAGARFEFALLEHLRGHGYPAPPIQRTRDGGIYFQAQGVLHMVMGLLPGSAYDPGDPAQLEAAARGLARYHSIVSELTPAGEPNRSSGLASLGQLGQENLYAAVNVVVPLLTPQAAAAVAEEARYLGERMEQLNVGLGQRQKELRSLVIHGSYGQSAVLVNGHQLTGVLDFDRSAYDLLALDLAYALRSFCREIPNRPSGPSLNTDRGRAFLRHYRSHAPLPDADFAALPEVFQAQRLIVVAKKCQNLLTKQAIVPRQSKDALSFSLLLKRECARVRWITHNPFPVKDDA